MHIVSTQGAQSKSNLSSATFRKLKTDLKYCFNWNENARAGICTDLERHSQICLWTRFKTRRELFHHQNFHCLVQTFLFWLPFLIEVKQSQLSPLLFYLSSPNFKRIHKSCTRGWIIYYYNCLLEEPLWPCSMLNNVLFFHVLNLVWVSECFS